MRFQIEQEEKGYTFIKSKKHQISTKTDENKQFYLIKFIDGKEVYRQKIPEFLFRKITDGLMEEKNG